MSLPKFVVGMIFVVATVAVWSYLETAMIGIVLLRMVSCAIMLQIGYFLIIFAMVVMSRRQSGQEATAPDRVTAMLAGSDSVSTPIIAGSLRGCPQTSAED
ncbi:hypothetical protein [Mesorhizobium amorphae]|uniref:hypothetical protein n=1 Tax=Mesorhizobium amorphae TaxID=71433 RepID=UPI00178113A7|nr:hypothetical protein [Mesorhizobium amorphae]